MENVDRRSERDRLEVTSNGIRQVLRRVAAEDRMHYASQCFKLFICNAAYIIHAGRYTNTTVYIVIAIGANANIQGGSKNGATLSPCKYSENSMTELRGNW